MAQVGNKCPGLQEYHKFETGYCINDCDHQCVPPSVLVHIQLAHRRDKHKGRYLSVTALLGCLRQLYLERTIEYYVEPPKSWWSLRGKIMHALLEQSEEVVIPNWQSETEYGWNTGLYWTTSAKSITTYPVDETSEPIILHGTIDVLRPETGEMYDYKTIGDNGLAYIKNGAKPDHSKQFNMYRLLVERGKPIKKDAQGNKYLDDSYVPVTIKRIRAFYMTMMQIAGTGGLMTENTDWRVSNPSPHQNMVGEPELLGSKSYLALKRGKRKETATENDYELKESKKWRITYAIPDVPLMDLDETEQFIREKVPLLVQAFELGIMPPMCEPEQRQWRCENYCPDQIRNACDKHNEKTGEKRIVEVEKNDEIPVEVV
jgi:hypothetical protein